MSAGHGGWLFRAGDPLRAYAALAVVAQHASLMALVVTGHSLIDIDPPDGFITAYGPVLGSVLRTGYFGLWVFFGLSGYLIGRPFVRAIVKGRPLPSIVLYARNRALRILPAYWTVLTIVLVCAWLLGTADPSVRQMAELYVLDFSPGNEAALRIAQAWSVALEVKFYIALPIVALVAAFGARRLPSALARALAIAVPCLVWLVVAPFVVDAEPPLQSLAYFSRLFAAGAAIAALEPFVQPLVAGRRRWATGAAVAMGAALLYVLATPALPYREGASDTGDLTMGIVVMTLIAAPLLRQWVDGGCWAVLDNRFSRWLGERSYSFFLIHLLVLYELGELIARWLSGYEAVLAVLLPAGIAVSALAADVLYRKVELPFLARKRRAAAGAEAAAEAPAGAPLLSKGRA